VIRSDGGEESPDRSAWPFDEDDVEQWAARIHPLVEEVSGRTFTVRVTIRLVDRARLKESLLHDLAPQIEALYGRTFQSEALHQQIKTAAEMMSRVMMGKYGFADRTLYLAPANLQSIMESGKVASKHADALAQLIIAHELTHALQDQHVDLSARIEAIGDIEESQALNATIEGHAVYVQDHVGARLELDDAVLELARLMSAGAVENDETPDGHPMARVMAAQFEQIYLGGRDFIAHHDAAGGAEAVWEIIHYPPKSTAVISRPERYAQVDSAEAVDLEALFDGLDRFFADRGFNHQTMPAGEMMVRSALALHEPETIESVIGAYRQGRALIMSHPTDGMMNTALLLEFNESDGAARYCEALREKFDETKRLLGEQGVDEETIAKFPDALQPLDIEEVDDSQSTHFPHNVLTGGAGSTDITRVRRGNVVCEFIALNDSEYDPDATRELFLEMLKRYEVARRN